MKKLDYYKTMLSENTKHASCPMDVKVSALQVMQEMMNDHAKLLKQKDDRIKDFEENIRMARW